MTRSFFADAGQSDYPEVTKICVARGFQDVTNYFSAVWAGEYH